MSLPTDSPPIRRLSTAASSREELINAYEAEEERIINVLSRKLEQLRQEKIGLENVLEAESESHVNRLTRELSALRLAQQQLQQQQQQNGASSSQTNGVTPGSAGSTGGVFSISPETRIGFQALAGRSDPLNPSPEVMLEAMRRENEQLRNRLSDTEREFVRITRLNDIYREELIEHRTRMGLPVDDLIGMPASDPLSQPTHRRSWASYSSTGSSPSTSVYHIPTSRPQHSNGVPIPRPPSQIHRPSHPPTDMSTPLSHSPSSSSDSPFPFSPPASSAGADPASYMTSTTNITSPPSSGPFNQAQQFTVPPGKDEPVLLADGADLNPGHRHR
ncbi:hypothetical protein NMY22_g18938 [Coprinellus aureogranulatus]|nr:hypothetical protein NMY22_g18938 [Coprinellus aureogranulatus]